MPVSKEEGRARCSGAVYPLVERMPRRPCSQGREEGAKTEEGCTGAGQAEPSRRGSQQERLPGLPSKKAGEEDHSRWRAQSEKVSPGSLFLGEGKLRLGVRGVGHRELWRVNPRSDAVGVLNLSHQFLRKFR